MKETQIHDLFDSIAPRYDLTNDFLSLGLHRIWNRRFINSLKKRTPHAKDILDLCAGTGELTLRHNDPKAHYTLADFSQPMLDIAQKRFPNAICIQANAKELPFKDNSFDVVMVSYGIRNIDDNAKAFKEVFRVLKPGGTFAILELSRPQNKVLRTLHSFYLKMFVTPVGKLVTKHDVAYGHLRDSISHFMEPGEITTLLKQTGFDSIQTRAYHGGIVSTFFACKRG